MLALSGCGGDAASSGGASTSREGATATAPNTTTKPPSTGAARFHGKARDNYEMAKAVCGAFPAKKVAHDLHLSTAEPARIATAYAHGYRREFRQAVIAGCRAGLRR